MESCIITDDQVDDLLDFLMIHYSGPQEAVSVCLLAIKRLDMWTRLPEYSNMTIGDIVKAMLDGSHPVVMQ